MQGEAPPHKQSQVLSVLYKHCVLPGNEVSTIPPWQGGMHHGVTGDCVMALIVTANSPLPVVASAKVPLVSG